MIKRIFIFVFFFLFAFTAKSVSASLIQENTFEAYTLGNISGQGNWSACGLNACANLGISNTVSNSKAKNGIKSLRINQSEGVLSYSGISSVDQIRMDFYPESGISQTVYLMGSSNNSNPMDYKFYVVFSVGATSTFVSNCGTGGCESFSVVNDSWHKFVYTISSGQGQMILDQSIDMVSSVPIWGSSFNYLSFYSGQANNFYIDDLGVTSSDIDPEGTVQIVNLEGYNLQIIYPMQDSYPNYQFGNSFGTTTIPFKFVYSIPNIASTSEFYFNAYEFASSSFRNLTQVLAEEKLSDLDADNNWTFNWNYDQVATSTHYIVFALYDSKTMESKYAVGISINSQEYVSQTTQDLGFWGNLFKSLFVPSYTTLNDWSGLRTSIEQKAPWGYITLLKAEFNDIDYNGSKLADFTGTDADDVFGTFRSFFTTFLWLLFTVYIVLRIRHLVIS